MSGHAFGFALGALKQGAKVRRKLWCYKALHLQITRPLGGFMTEPFITLVKTVANQPVQKVPWQPLHADLLAEDWEGVE